MRKVLAISLIFIYVALFGGFKLSMHFCGDTLTDYSIYTSSIEDSSCCSSHHSCSKHEAKKMSCCEDKSVFLYSDINTTIDSYELIPAAYTIAKSSFSAEQVLMLDQAFHYQSNAPPIYQGRAIYQINSSFTFYG